MGQETSKKIGLITGDEKEWPAAFLAGINQQKGFVGEMAKIGPTYMDEPIPYSVIVDRISHDIPYYRAYLKYAAVQGAYLINDPLTKAIDQKFFGIALIQKLGLKTPRTVVLPNKDIDVDTNPDSFRNLKYPMIWNDIIDYVGVPAILKDIKNGGRRDVRRVIDVDDLLRNYDESGIRTMVLQQIIESDNHIHCFVVGQKRVMCLQYSLKDGRYLPDILPTNKGVGRKVKEMATKITQAFQYDINMVEFVAENDELYVINPTNPSPEINQDLMTTEQFSWCVAETVNITVERANNPIPNITDIFLSKSQR
ncbi:MAG: hypothetical protein AAF490_32190 [Chloroflexota bacterium]